jgi:small-conductance mechanosensitive channel
VFTLPVSSPPDITLFSTTLRFGASNEVATISNGSIASSRITNCARSANAMVILILKLHIHLHDEQNLEKFKAALENYVADNPRLWELMAFFRCEEIDTDGEFVVYRYVPATLPMEIYTSLSSSPVISHIAPPSHVTSHTGSL